MTTSQFVIAAFAALIGGLLLPLGHGIRSAIVLALVALTVFTLLGGGLHQITQMFN